MNDIGLPQKCPNSTVLDYLYKQSMENEQLIFAHIERQKSSNEILWENEIKPLSTGQLLDFNTDWEKTVEKYCSVDGTKILKQESWQEFFRSSFQ